MTCNKYWLLGGIVGFCFNINSASGQIIPDRTTDTSVYPCQNTCNITGGTVAGQNLFHSFTEFNVGAGESIYFADPGVTNIFNRVTGSNISNINGTLGVSDGNANLWLLNSNGIIFGEGGSLDLNGSFVATTADEIQFGNGNSFSAIPQEPENLALLTVDPSALFFNQMGHKGSIVAKGANLSVPPKSNITFVGQQTDENSGIWFEASSLNAPEGNISLGAIAGEGKIGINLDSKLNFPKHITKGNINLTQSSSLNGSGTNPSSIYLTGDSVKLAGRSQVLIENFGSADDGEINLEVNHLSIQENSKILSSNSSTSKGNSADINVKAQSVEVIGRDNRIFQQFLIQNVQLADSSRVDSSVIETLTFGTGDSGNINIEAKNLFIDRGGRVGSTTFDRGATGNLNIDISDALKISGSGLFTGSTAFVPGAVGKISINTDRLTIAKAGVISSSTLGNGDAGSLNINASSLIEIQDTPANSFIPTGIYSNAVWGVGKGGNLGIDTPKLTISGGSSISASSGGIINNNNVTDTVPFGGNGGNVAIDAESVNIQGASADGKFSSSILNNTTTNNPAGDLIINTENLLVNENGFISASSIGTGEGGNISIKAANSVNISGNSVNSLQQLLLESLQGKLKVEAIRGGLAALTINDGRAGNITIDTPQLNVNNGAIVSTATFGKGDAGNLNINVAENVNITGAAIISPTFAEGDAGKIELYTKNLNILQGGAIASASVGSGSAGDISILARESIAISNIIPNLLFSGSISTGSYRGEGFSGNLAIDTNRLSLIDGANIETNNIAIKSLIQGQNALSVLDNSTTERGRLTIDASESITILGKSSVENLFNISSSSRISSTTSTSAPASNIVINTKNLSIFDGGEISVNSIGTGSAGTLAIAADYLTIADRARLNGTTLSGRGGNINLAIDDIIELRDRSEIDTNAIGEGNGGNIKIDTTFVIARDTSKISANALSGRGGNINITAKDLFIAPDSSISASSKLGIDGEVEIETFDTYNRNNLVELPGKTIRANNLIVKSCSSRDRRNNVFSYTGKGGVSPNLLTEYYLGDRALIADFALPKPETNNTVEIDNLQLTVSPKARIEAATWKINAKGKVELIAQADGYMLPTLNNCPFKK